jgi:osmotically-inducible protein OsmY
VDRICEGLIQGELAMQSNRSSAKRLFAGTVIAVIALAAAAPTAQSVSARQAIERVRTALERLPRYGVFDFVGFELERGSVTLVGYAYEGQLRSDAVTAVSRLDGIEEVGNQIEILPASQNDDRIRWSTFYNIYTDSFLSRYAPGGAMGAYHDALRFRRFPGLQPFGNHPIHIVVNRGRTTLYGIVDSESDKMIAGVRAREISGVFGVTNELVVDED